MRKYFISVIAIVALAFTACDDYLDQVPEKDVETFESIFERRASADIWLTQATEFMAGSFFTGFGGNAGVVGADEFVTGWPANESGSVRKHLDNNLLFDPDVEYVYFQY